MFKTVINSYKKFKNKIKNNIPFFIISLLIFLFLVVYLANSIFITIKAGEAGVLYRKFFGGTVVDRVYGEGLHILFPWDTMFIYNVRIQEAPKEFEVLTKNGLKVKLIVSIRYSPEYFFLGALHKRIGPEYLNIVIIPQIETILRVVLGKLDVEEVYTSQRAVIEKTLNEAIEQVSQRYIFIDNVLIKRIILPEAIEKAIENKAAQKQKAEAYIYMVEQEKKEAEMKKIKAEGYKIYNETIRASLTQEILKWESIQATLKLAESQNSKIVVIGDSKSGMPIIGSIPFEKELNPPQQITPPKIPSGQNK
ncbi:MAG: prohibitin family protein [Desulfobacterales bacterium]|nr:prohibitin family protein [Desulfobacterales bacterium]